MSSDQSPDGCGQHPEVFSEYHDTVLRIPVFIVGLFEPWMIEISLCESYWVAHRVSSLNTVLVTRSGNARTTPSSSFPAVVAPCPSGPQGSNTLLFKSQSRLGFTRQFTNERTERRTGLSKNYFNIGRFWAQPKKSAASQGFWVKATFHYADLAYPSPKRLIRP